MSPATQPKPSSDNHVAARASEILAGHRSKRSLSRLWPFLGPAFIVSIAYVDPGNFATNDQAGAKAVWSGSMTAKVIKHTQRPLLLVPVYKAAARF